MIAWSRRFVPGSGWTWVPTGASLALSLAIGAQAPPAPPPPFVHPTIAPLRPGLVLPGHVRDTPLWNRGDGVWNLGEGFGPPGTTNPADLGGFRGVEENSGVTAADLYA